MQNLDVYKKDSGKIWQRKAASGSDGLILTIAHSASATLPLNSRNVRFLHSAFDSSGDRLVAGDYQGNIYVFDLHANRFSLVQKTGSPCSALAFTLRRRNEFLVAMADYSLKCFDCDSKELVAMMKSHESIIHSISVHSSGRFAITTSSDTAQLWDLDTFQRKRKLNVKENVAIVKVFFLPMSNTIITCFKDDSIFAWDSETLTCKYQLHSPDVTTQEKPSGFKTFATPRDGRILIAGGRSRFLHMWSLDSQNLLHVIELPQKVKCVHQLEFLVESFDGGSNQILGVLSQDGVMRFINVNTFSQLFEIGRLDERVSSVAVCPNGRYIAAVMDNGNVNVYSAHSITRELNKPPPPLVKVLKSNKIWENSFATQDSNKRIAKENGKTLARKTDQTGNMMEYSYDGGLSLDRLLSILKGYGEYPSKYRMFIWRTILHLPENHSSYASLVEKGTHPSFDKLHERYPIKSQKLLRVLQRVLSALAHWSPIFGETDYIPLLAFPFVKLFQNNQLVCFEMVATILTSWCQHWFEYFPNPPINVLGLVENVLVFHDKELLQHFVKYGITSQIYAWPLLSTFFSEVLTREEWLKLADNVFSNHPSFLLMAAVAYCIVGRTALLRCTEQDDFKYFFHHRNAMSVGELIKEAYHLSETTPQDVNPSEIIEGFSALTKGQYPIFNKFPKFIVDFQVQEKERIRKEEEDYLKQKSATSDLRLERERRQAEEEGWYRQQQLLQEAEQTRRHLITKEEEKLSNQRMRLSAMNREMRMKELQLLDATRRKFINFTQQQKEAELSRLDDEIRRKVKLRDAETKAAIEEIEIKNLELQFQKKLFEQELYREHVDLNERQKSEWEAEQKRNEIVRQKMINEREMDRMKELQTRTVLLQNLAHVDQMDADVDNRLEMEYRMKVDELEKEKSEALLSRLNDENKVLEESVKKLMKETERRKADSARSKSEELTGRQAANSAYGFLRTREKDDDDDVEPEQQSDSDTNEDLFISLHRDRRAFEEKEQELMNRVRKLRQKVAQENRYTKPLPVAAAASSSFNRLTIN